MNGGIFSGASSFHSGVSRGRRIASSGRLAPVLQRLHSASPGRRGMPGRRGAGARPDFRWKGRSGGDDSVQAEGAK